MSVNKYRPHVFVLPEDDANRRIANGFLLEESLDLRAIQVLPNGGGWTRVRDAFETAHINKMRLHRVRHVVLLVDFDGDVDRRHAMNEVVPADLADRVFVIGVWSEPQELARAGLGNFEDIGHDLARECRNDSRVKWNHDLLQHNASELDRMTSRLRPFLFPGQ